MVSMLNLVIYLGTFEFCQVTDNRLGTLEVFYLLFEQAALKADNT